MLDLAFSCSGGEAAIGVGEKGSGGGGGGLEVSEGRVFDRGRSEDCE